MSSLRPVHGSPAQVLTLLREWDAGAREPEPLCVETSGSTGAPKRVLLSRAAMRASARGTEVRLGGPGQWLLSLPPVHVAGLQVLFRSVRAGTDPVHQRATFAEAAAELTGSRRYVSLVPTQLTRLLSEPTSESLSALRALDAVLVGGAALAPRLRARAESEGVRVVATYGTSETCGGCVYDGLPLDGVAVKVDRHDRVLIGGATLFDGYAGDVARTAEVLRGGWLRTDDIGRLDDDGRLEVLGRADDVVVSGGVKVPATAVARALAAHPDVVDAEVVGVPDAEWGERVVAVVASPVAELALADLRDLVRPRTWAPRAVRVVPELPTLSTGKVDRLAVRRLAADA